VKKQHEGGFLIAKIHHLSGRIFAKMLKTYGIDEISPQLGRILFVLWQKDGISINELAKRTALSKSTLTIMLDRLEEKGYVIRVPSKEDRRVILIKRTEKDKRLENKYTEVSNVMTELFYKDFSPNEIDEFENYLKRILANLIKQHYA